MGRIQIESTYCLRQVAYGRGGLKSGITAQESYAGSEIARTGWNWAIENRETCHVQLESPYCLRQAGKWRGAGAGTTQAHRKHETCTYLESI